MTFATIVPLLEVALKALDAIVDTVDASTDQSHPTIHVIRQILDTVSGAKVGDGGEIDVAGITARIAALKSRVAADNAEVAAYEDQKFPPTPATK